MALPLLRTLGDIRSDIQSRCGFGSAGQAGVVNSALIDSMIRSAQKQLYEQFEWRVLDGVSERLTGADQQYYDYPEDCNLEEIKLIAINWGGRFRPLKEGINLEHRSLPSTGVPERYERRDQYELWPIPISNQYTIRLEYTKVLKPLVVDSDRVSINDEIIFLFALSTAKQHYKQDDAATYSTQLDALLLRLKAKNRGKQVWDKRDKCPPDPYRYVTSDQDV